MLIIAPTVVVGSLMDRSTGNVVLTNIDVDVFAGVKTSFAFVMPVKLEKRRC